jgi:hypothetical protein
MEKEYQMIDGTAKDCQETLNQWKHMYDLEIISMCNAGGNYLDTSGSFIIILLTRTRKEGK